MAGGLQSGGGVASPAEERQRPTRESVSERRGIRQKQRVAKYRLHLDSKDAPLRRWKGGRRRGDEMMKKKSAAQTNTKYAIANPNHAISCNLLDIIITLWDVVM